MENKPEEEVVKMETDPVETTEVKQVEKAAPKRRKYPKKKKKRTEGLPKHYKNAYVRYCDAIRPKVLEEQPTLDPIAITKLVADRWFKCSVEEKQPFLDEAKIDKDRFKEEMKVYKEEHPDYDPNGQNKNKKKNKEEPEEKPKSEKNNKKSEKSKSENNSTEQSSKVHEENHVVANNFELPIFTDVFLSHNTQIETELKQLRKLNNETELQNDFLQKFIENMQNGISKISNEISLEKHVNSNLEMYLTKLRCILASNFNSLSLPNSKGASVENVEKYLSELTSSESNIQPSVFNKAKEIVKKSEIKI